MRSAGSSLDQGKAQPDIVGAVMAKSKELIVVFPEFKIISAEGAMTQQVLRHGLMSPRDLIPESAAFPVIKQTENLVMTLPRRKMHLTATTRQL